MEIPKNLVRKIECIVHNNATKIFYYHPPVADNGLFKGQIGASIFLCNYGRYYGRMEYMKKGIDLIQNSFDNIHTLDHSYANGIGGLVWAVRYLSKNNFIVFEDIHIVNTLLNSRPLKSI